MFESGECATKKANPGDVGEYNEQTTVHDSTSLQKQIFLLSCAPGPPTPLSILVRASMCCSVKGEVHSVVRDLQFLWQFLTWNSLHFSEQV